MNLEIEVKSNASIATNVLAVSNFYREALKKYEGLVATPDTLKDDKKKCTDINKLKKFVAEQRIAFDRAIEEQPDVKAVHDALKAIEDKCDEVRNPYWQSCKAIEDANKPAEEVFNFDVMFTTTAKVFESLKRTWAKSGVKFTLGQIFKADNNGND